MKEYFEPKEVFILTLFALLSLHLASAPYSAIIPFFFLFLGTTGLKNSLNYELNRIYHGDFSNPHEAYKLSFIFILLALLTSYYFRFGSFFLLVILSFFLAYAIKAKLSFFSDILYFLSMFFTFSIPFGLNPPLPAVPFIWTLSLLLLLRKVIWDLIRPFGIENYNLAKLLGVKGAVKAYYLISFLALIWLAMPAFISHSLYASLYAIPFSFVILAAYLVKTNRSREAKDVLELALLAYLFVSIFL